MVRNTFSINFLCESSRVSKDGTAPLYCSVSINGKRVRFPLQKRCSPKEFTKLMSGKKQNDLKAYCSEITRKMREIQTELIQKDIPVTSQNIMKYFRWGCTDSYTLGTLWKEYLKKLEIRKGVSMTADTFVRYEAVRDIMFSKWGESCEVSSLCQNDFEILYSELERTNFQSTVAAKFQKIKSVMEWAFENGYIKSNPSRHIKLNKTNKPAVFLTDSEVEKIWSHDFSYTPRLERVRDLFVFQCSCGLAYCDLAELKPEDIQEQNGTYFIEKARKKTSVMFTSVILPRGVEVLKKYNFTIPEVISNQKLNCYIKEICTLSGVMKNVHSHTGRHTYCTSLLNSGVRLETIAKAAGHTNTKMSAHYAKFINGTVLSEISSKF